MITYIDTALWLIIKIIIAFSIVRFTIIVPAVLLDTYTLLKEVADKLNNSSK